VPHRPTFVLATDSSALLGIGEAAEEHQHRDDEGSAREKKINLNALFDGKSPFDTDERSAELDAAEFRPKSVKAEGEVDEGEEPAF
jgi:hypothetical protein